jgi:argininosuccinate lyase
VGHLMSLLMTVKGLPLAYNRDLQEDKEPLFDSLDTVKASVNLMAGMLSSLDLREDRIAQALRGGYLSATDMADYLVQQGVPFRTAHEQVGRLVRYAEFQGKELMELSIEEIQRFASQAGADVFDWLAIENVVDRRNSPGGTAPVRVAEVLARVEEELGLCGPEGLGAEAPAGGAS